MGGVGVGVRGRRGMRSRGADKNFGWGRSHYAFGSRDLITRLWNSVTAARQVDGSHAEGSLRPRKAKSIQQATPDTRNAAEPRLDRPNKSLKGSPIIAL